MLCVETLIHMQGVSVSVMVEDADCMQRGEPTVGISMLGAGVLPVYHSLICILKGLSVCKLAFFLRRLNGKMHSASIPEALTAVWSRGKAELILKKALKGRRCGCQDFSAQCIALLIFTSC